jgi:hypothetical protein
MNRTLYLKPMRRPNRSIQKSDSPIRSVEDPNNDIRVSQRLRKFFLDRVRKIAFAHAKPIDLILEIVEPVQEPFGCQRATPVILIAPNDVHLDQIPEMDKLSLSDRFTLSERGIRKEDGAEDRDKADRDSSRQASDC